MYLLQIHTHTKTIKQIKKRKQQNLKTQGKNLKEEVKK